MSDKPVLLFVTGAWHPPKCYDGLKNAFTDLGYECVIPKLPTVGADSHGVTWEADKAKIVETAEPFFTEGREVVLVAHSYGGIPATAATQGQGTPERARVGLRGGFHSIIFLTAFAIPNKLTTMVHEQARNGVYSGCSEEAIKSALEATLPHSQDAFETSLDFIASDITIPKTYIICEKDQLLLLPLQEQLVNSTPGMKAARLETGHSPFLEQRLETADLIVKIVEGRA
ncbi:hypothetical protein FSARC_13877 [Fusarium sarcochroum]|uniref:AB hydrolase-1 domain-containing protein n=1 Tax=Fusarium sarcochroum TaxID=1208366 RepID=A0A8H4SY76_9HYPO|nr:hypothetical protein FSARC_13877 [Fusarium sarcochroum]